MNDLAQAEKLFPESAERSNQDIVNSLIFENRSKAVKNFDMSQLKKDLSHKKRIREDQYVKQLDPEQRPVLVVKDQQKFATEPKPKVFGRKDEDQEFLKLTKKAEVLADAKSAIEQQRKEVRPLPDPEERGSREGSPQKPAGDVYYKIDGIEFLPEGYLELDPLIFKDEYNFGSEAFERLFKEEQRRIKALRRKQYEQRNEPKRREITIFVKDPAENKIQEFLENWYFKNKRKMNAQELEYVSKLMNVEPQSMETLQAEFLNAKRVQNSQHLDEYLTAGDYQEKLQKLPNYIRKRLQQNEKFRDVKPRVYETAEGYNPQVISKYERKGRRKNKNPYKDKINNVPGDPSRLGTSKIYQTERPRRENPDASKTGEPQPKWNNFIQDFEGVIKGLVDRDFKATGSLPAPVAPPEAVPKVSRGKTPSKEDRIKLNAFPTQAKGEELQKYFNQEMDNIFSRFEKLPNEEEEERQSARQKSMEEPAKSSTQPLDLGEVNIRFLGGTGLNDNMGVSSKYTIDIDEKQNKDPGQLKKKKTREQKQPAEGDPNAVSWAFASFTHDRQNDNYAEVKQVAELEDPLNRSQNEANAAKEKSLDPNRSLHAAKKETPNKLNTKSFSFEHIPPAELKGVQEADELAKKKQMEIMSQCDPNSIKNFDNSNILIPFLHNPKRVTIVARGPASNCFLAQKLKPTLIGIHYYYPVIHDECKDEKRVIKVSITDDQNVVAASAVIPDGLVGTFYDAFVENQRLEGDLLDAARGDDAVRLVIKNERGQEVAVLPIVPKADDLGNNFDQTEIIIDPKGRNMLKASLKRKNYSEERFTLRPFLVGAEYYTQVLTVNNKISGQRSADLTTFDDAGEMINVQDVDFEKLSDTYMAEVISEKVDDAGRRTFKVLTRNNRGEVICELDIEPLRNLMQRNFAQYLEEIVDERGNRKLTFLAPSPKKDPLVTLQQIIPTRYDVRAPSSALNNSQLVDAVPITILESEEISKIKNPQQMNPAEFTKQNLPDLMNEYFNNLMKNKDNKPGEKSEQHRVKRYPQFQTLPEPVVKFGNTSRDKEKARSPSKINVESLVQATRESRLMDRSEVLRNSKLDTSQVKKDKANTSATFEPTQQILKDVYKPAAGDEKRISQAREGGLNEPFVSPASIEPIKKS